MREEGLSLPILSMLFLEHRKLPLYGNF